MLDFLTPVIAAVEELWQAHRWVFYAAGFYGAFTAFTSSLPAPDPANDKGYRILYNFCHIVSLNLARVIPFLRMKERNGN